MAENSKNEADDNPEKENKHDATHDGEVAIGSSNAEAPEHHHPVEQCCLAPWTGRRNSWREIRRRREEEGEEDDREEKARDVGSVAGVVEEGQCCEVWPPPLWRRRRSRIQVTERKKTRNKEEQEEDKVQQEEGEGSKSGFAAVVRIRGESFTSEYILYMWN